MSILTTHTKDLKNSIIRTSLVFLILCVISWNYSERILHYLISLSDLSIITVSIFEMLHCKLLITGIVSLFLCLPYIYVEVYRFISPALLKKERTIILWSSLPFFIMVTIGAVFALTVFIPVSMIYVNQFYITDVSNTVTLEKYISFILTSVVLFGMIFCMPIVLSILSYIGIINFDIMIIYRKHVYVGMLFIGALITPPDIFTLLLMSIPLIFLYEISIGISYIMSLKNSNKDEVIVKC